MKDQAIEATIAAAAQKTAAGGGVIALYGGMTANDVAASVGATVAILGLIVQVVFKLLDNKRKRELHQWRLRGARFPDDDSEG